MIKLTQTFIALFIFVACGHSQEKYESIDYLWLVRNYDLESHDFCTSSVDALDALRNYLEEPKSKLSKSSMHFVEKLIQSYEASDLDFQPTQASRPDMGEYLPQILSPLKKLKAEGDVTPDEIREVFTKTIPIDSLHTPVKQGKNTYLYARKLHPSPAKDSPKRRQNLKRMWDGKAPRFNETAERTDRRAECHHMGQENSGESLVYIPREFHKENDSLLHLWEGASQIDRNEFTKEKKRANRRHVVSRLIQLITENMPPIDSF